MNGYNERNDADLLPLLKRGDHDAFTEIYHRYSGLLYVFAYKRLRNREESKDVIHELFLSLWVNRENVTLTTGLAAYLYTAVRNKVINKIVHQKIATRYIDSFQHYMERTENSTDHLVRHHELLEFVEREIASLPPKTRLVFEMSRKTNLSRKEIAEKLQLSEETVKSHMHGALKTLRIKLGALFFLVF